MVAYTAPRHGSEDAVDRLIADLTGTDPHAAERASMLLKELGEDAVPALCAALASSSPVALSRIARVLGRIASPAAGAPLRRLLADWIRIEPRSVESPVEVLRVTLVEHVLHALSRIDRAGNARAIGVGLMDCSPKVRRIAAGLLERAGTTGHAVLCRALEPGSPGPGIEAAQALENVGGREAILALCKGLNSPHLEVQATCSAALLHLARRRPLLELRRALPRLKVLSRVPGWGAAEEARQTAQRAFLQIESVTATIRDVPLPAAAPESSCDTLPLPAMARIQELESPSSPRASWTRRLRSWILGDHR
jgi:hypothetical protein